MSSTAPAARHHSPIPKALVGICVLLFWFYVTLLQIQTSEALVLGTGTSSLLPSFKTLLQIPEAFQGQLSPTMVKAFIWGYGVQLIFLVMVVGYDHARQTIHSSSSTLGAFFTTGMWLIVLYNFVSDFLYGMTGMGWWGQLGYALIASFVVAFLGLVGVNFLVKAWNDWSK